jgi:hypothetical protein
MDLEIRNDETKPERKTNILPGDRELSRGGNWGGKIRGMSEAGTEFMSSRPAVWILLPVHESASRGDRCKYQENPDTGWNSEIVPKLQI